MSNCPRCGHARSSLYTDDERRDAVRTVCRICGWHLYEKPDPNDYRGRRPEASFARRFKLPPDHVTPEWGRLMSGESSQIPLFSA